MGTPYQRQDTSNNIANGNIINADDLDNEFNAIQGAFAAVTGHSHDGTTGEGGPITVVGPAQDLAVSATQVLPKTNNTLDLGSASFKFKDAYVDGILYADGINFNGTAISATAAEINHLSGVTSSVQTQLNARQPLDAELTALAGLTSAADRLPYFTGLGTAALATFTAFGRSLVDDADAAAGRTTLGLGTIATQAANSVSITGGSITGITDLTVADGGTGVSTITGIIRGNGTSPFTAAVAGTDFLAPAAIGVTVQAFDADLSAVAGLSTNGIMVRTGAGTATTRSVTAGAGISVSNGDGVAGNITIASTVAGVPSGAIMSFAMNTAPTGWLACSGQAVSRTTYASLFAAIGTLYGAGDGSTTFNLPDLRGEFVRGWDNGRGIDTGRVFGSAQLDQLQGHQHSARIAQGVTGVAAGPNEGIWNSGVSPISNVVLDAISDGTNGVPRVGSETRPRNRAFLYCIKE